MSQESLVFRLLQPGEIDAVLDIERACYPSPWSREQFLQEMQNPVSRIDVLGTGSEIAGYICYWLISGEMQILNVATAPTWRRQGIADRLLEHAFKECRQRGLVSAWLEVRVGNKGAIALYRKHDFVDQAVRQGYYRDGEDALLMVRKA